MGMAIKLKHSLFIQALSESKGNIKATCERTNFSRQAVYGWRKKYPIFCKEWDNIIEAKHTPSKEQQEKESELKNIFLENLEKFGNITKATMVSEIQYGLPYMWRKCSTTFNKKWTEALYKYLQKNPDESTKEYLGKREEFIKYLYEYGTVNKAIQMSKISAATLYKWRKETKSFCEAWDDAIKKHKQKQTKPAEIILKEKSKESEQKKKFSIYIDNELYKAIAIKAIQNDTTISKLIIKVMAEYVGYKD